MYGVPATLTLKHFVGATLIRVSLGEFQIQFHFHPESEITVEGRWELRDTAGGLVDQARSPAERDAYRRHVLLGRRIVEAHVDAPTSIALQFDSGHRLEIFDSSSEYECFTIQPDGIVV